MPPSARRAGAQLRAGPLPTLAKALIPGVKSTGPMIDASLPFITQLRYLVSPSELRGLTADLAQTVPALARLTRETIPLMANGVRPAASCAVNVVHPVVPADPQRPALQRLERVPAAPGVRRGGRLPARPGRRVARLRRQRPVHPDPRHRRDAHLLAPAGAVRAGAGAAPGRAAAAASGRKRPPLEPNVPCETPAADHRPVGADRRAAPQQQSSNLSAPGASLRWTSAGAAALPQIQQLAAQDGLKLGTAAMPTTTGTAEAPSSSAVRQERSMKRAIREHWKDFGAIVGLLVITVVVAGYILSHERLRFPFISSTPFTINAAFQTAQAVTPGQGQSVRVSGVQIGLVGSVTLKNGQGDRADEHRPQVQAPDPQELDGADPATHRPGRHVHRARARGIGNAPVAKPGYTIPISNTMPVVNLDEILGSLDADSREYLDLLVNGAGQGLEKNGGDELAQVMERFEPTHQDLARLNGAVAQRGRNLQQLVNSLRRLNDALAAKQTQIVQLVDSSEKVFARVCLRGLERQPRGGDLPGDAPADHRHAGQGAGVRPGARPGGDQPAPGRRGDPGRQPGAHRAGRAGRADRQEPDPPVRDRLASGGPQPPAGRRESGRPDTVQTANGPVQEAPATPNLTNVFTVLNHFGNMLGYNPGNTEHGYLWWLAWLDHNARTLFSVQDANGDFRPLFLQASCATYAQLVNQPGAGPLTEVVDEPHADPDRRQPVPDPGGGRRQGLSVLPGQAPGQRTASSNPTLSSIQALQPKAAGSKGTVSKSSNLFLPKLPHN